MQLSDALEKIREYQAKLGYDYEYPSMEERMKHVRDLSLAQVVEVVEFLDWTPWKPWRSLEDQTFNREEAALELVDQFFFMANLWAAIGMTPKEFEFLFLSKLSENLDRIERGYNKAN